MNKSIMITGGFGYIGGRVGQFIADQVGYNVLLGSRLQTQSPPWLPQAKVVQTLWGSPEKLENTCANVEAIVHTAGMNAQDCAADPVAALELNAVATARLLQAAIRGGVKRFIYISTAHVYSSSLTGVINEKTCPSNLHPYASSHRAGEDVILAAHQRGEIEGIVVRLSNAYGAPAHKDANCWMLLVNDLCRQAVTTRHLELQSSGLQRRDFVPLTDVSRAINHLLHLSGHHLANGVFNIGGEWSPTVWEMACLIQERCSEVLGFCPELKRATAPNGEAPDELDYRLDALRQSGFQLDSSKVVEIDKQLEFCKLSFC